jgi:glutamyl-tRNA reductase
MVVGEPQILGQLKAAYAVAKSSDCLNGLLESVVAGFQCGQAGALETGIGQMAVSVSSCRGRAGAQDFRIARWAHRHDRGQRQDV